MFSGSSANNFFSAFNLSLIIQQVTIIGILGAAQTLVILTAGIDLSVAAVMVLSYMVMARLAVQGDVPSLLAVVIGLAVGLACGLFNGSLVTRTRLLPVAVAVLSWLLLYSFGVPLIYVVPIGMVAALAVGWFSLGPAVEVRLPPFIVTLGAWSIFFALNLWYSESETIRSQDIDATAPLLKVFGLRVEVLGAQFTLGSFLMIGIFAALWYALTWTAWGRAVYAVGDDKEAAELSGIRTDRVLLSVYGVAGLLCAIGGWAAIGRVGSASPQSFYEANLDAITAVVIGGTSLFGGRGGHLRYAFRRAHRRRLPLRPQAGRCRRALADLRRGPADHRRRCHGPVDQEGQRMSVKPVMTGRGLTKRYGRVTAMDRADFELFPGEVLAIIGDNGAGKSTMVKALCGAVQVDEGEIRLDGEPVNFASPMDARDAGIETVYQNLALSPALSIADNMFLGRELYKDGIAGSLFRMLDKKRMRDFAREKLTELGLMTVQSITQTVETLSGGQRQGVAVARAAAFATKFVIMDEPTAALGVKESRRVLELIQDVRARGMPIVLISHNMPHVFEVADRIHIHRLSRRHAVIRPQDFSMSDAVAIMTGAMEPPGEIALPEGAVMT